MITVRGVGREVAGLEDAAEQRSRAQELEEARPDLSYLDAFGSRAAR